MYRIKRLKIDKSMVMKNIGKELAKVVPVPIHIDKSFT